MKRFLVSIVLLGFAGSAWAQGTAAKPQPATDDSRGYVAVVGGGTYWQTGGALFGGEAGLRITDSLEVFVEGGRMTDVTNKSTKDAAVLINNYIGSLGRGAAGYEVKSPVNYGAVGARYLLGSGDWHPYVALSVGGANIERKTTFSLGGSDITGGLTAVNVQLGKDLAGKSNKGLITAGAGVRMPVGGLLLDLGARYGRIFTDPGTNLLRVSAAVAYRF